MNISATKTASKPMFFELDIKDPPPVLTLLINPNTLNKSFSKRIVQARIRPTSRDRGAYTLQYNQDELDVLSCSGSSAMFYSERGLTTTYRTDTLAYRNLKSLVEIYRNNGRNFAQRQKYPLVSGGDGLIESVGRVIIAYDDIVYRGSFDSFSIQEHDQKPFNLMFDFQFVVSESIDVRNP